MAIDYFTKLIEIILLKEVDQRSMTSFVMEHIVHQFGILEVLVTNQASYFSKSELIMFAESYKFQVTHSSPYLT